MRIKMYPAKNGDAILIRSDGDSDYLVLIDGGFASTMREFVIPDLSELADHGKILNLVISTHIDADHITGLLELFAQNGNAKQPKIISIEEVWHNSLRALVRDSEIRSELCNREKQVLKAIKKRGFPTEAALKEEISAKQGLSLSGTLDSQGYCWNRSDGTQLVCADSNIEATIGKNLTISVIGPPEARLLDLQEWWLKKVRRFGLTNLTGNESEFEGIFEFVCAIETEQSNAIRSISATTGKDKSHSDRYVADNSPTNGSSITTIFDDGVSRFLALGDAWSEDVEKVFNHQGTATFDAIKLSHHGSLRNTSPKLLQHTDSPAYLISTNGDRHNHPDFQLLRAIVDRPAEFTRTLYFNYSTPASEALKEYRNERNGDFKIIEGSRDWISIKPTNK